jgi:hypothetical protein
MPFCHAWNRTIFRPQSSRIRGISPRFRLIIFISRHFKCQSFSICDETSDNSNAGTCPSQPQHNSKVHQYRGQSRNDYSLECVGNHWSIHVKAQGYRDKTSSRQKGAIPKIGPPTFERQETPEYGQQNEH